MTSPATRHPSLATGRRPAAFTLIELLVVIAIIAILAGLGFAGMQGAMESSKKAQARNDVHQIASAVKAYLLEYGQLPTGNTIAKLTDPAQNPRGIVFLEAKNAKGTPPKGGLSGNNMLDPWGGIYTITLDEDYNNQMDHRDTTHLTSVIVETTPPGNNQRPINNVQ